MAKPSHMIQTHVTGAYAYLIPFALSTMLDNTASALTITKLFNQLIEPILLYCAEQWLLYVHPRKVEQVSPTKIFASLHTQLSTEQVLKQKIYSHYSLHSITPILGVRADLGMFPTYIQAILRLSKYMVYPTGDASLVNKAVITQNINCHKIQVLLVVKFMANTLQIPSQ